MFSASPGRRALKMPSHHDRRPFMISAPLVESDAEEAQNVGITVSRKILMPPPELLPNSASSSALPQTYELLVESVVDYAIYMLDLDGKVASWNSGAQRIKGFTAAEIIGTHFSRFYREEDVEAGMPEQALKLAAEAGRFTTEAWRRRKDGSLFWAMVVIDPIYHEGRLIGFAKVTRDLTERWEAQQELEKSRELLFQAQKTEAIGQLTGGLAHDFNNLLTAISGSLEVMKRRVVQGRYQELDHHIAAAEGAAARAAALTHRLLAFSRRQVLDPRPTQANQLIQGMEDLIRRSVGPAIDLATDLTEDIWPILCDPNQLENALLNLCINARDAMAGTGRMTISTANERLDRPMSQGLDLVPGDYVALRVTDTGAGMPPEVASRAFDPFFTTKPIGKGTGLGLSMVHGFAGQSGGQARIHSVAGQGTTVTIRLPRHAQPAEPATEPPAAVQQAVPRAAHGETVLIVDDEVLIRMVVVEVLQEAGYSVIQAGDGASALKVVEAGTRIDLLVTDVGLPGGMNGRQLADAAREKRPGLKVLFITGYAVRSVIGDAPLENGMYLLTKPFSLDALGERIAAVLGQAPDGYAHTALDQAPGGLPPVAEGQPDRPA